MDQKQFLKQVVELNQVTFNNAFNVMALLQDQFEKTANKTLDNIPGMPVEGRKAIDNWAELFKNNRNSFKQQIDSGFGQAEKLLIG